MFKYKKIFLSIIVYIVTVFIYNYYTYNDYKQKEIATINDKLKLGAYTVYNTLGEEFFKIAREKSSISREEDWKNINRLSFYNKQAKLAFIYSSIKKNNKIYLTSSSASKEELANKSELHYFHYYNDAGNGLVESFESKKIVYDNYTDKWGSFRAVHIPIILDNSQLIVISSEISMKSYHEILNNIAYKHFWETLFYLLLTIPIIITVNLFIKDKNKQNFKTEQELAESEKMAASLFEVAPIFIDAFDKDGKCILWNKECEKVFGWTIEDINNSSNPLSLFYPEVKMQKKAMDTIFNEEEKIFRQWHPLNKKGEELTTMWAHIRLPKGEIINIGYDLTKNIQNEKLIFEQSKMIAIGEMIGNIAHQWRQPLSIISTVATGVKVQKEINVLTDNDLINNMDIINNTTQYLSDTIENFGNSIDLSNSKIKKFLLSDFLNKTLDLIHSQLISKDIEIIQNLEECEVESLENELIQVLTNILNNSKDVLCNIKNQRRLIFINMNVKDNILFIEIKDNGNGIKEDYIDKIFEPYFTTKHQSQGTGIALYMAEEIVRRYLKGDISVSNENYSYDNVDYTGAKFTIKISLI